MKVQEALQKIQVELKAPKNQYSSFGGYHYRSCEDILDAVKPLLKETDTYLTFDAEMFNIGERCYMKITAMLNDMEGGIIGCTGIAREPVQPKAKMDECQATGCAFTYAKKYALSSLFAIDDTMDSDQLTDALRGQTDTKNSKSNSSQTNRKPNNHQDVTMDDLYSQCIAIAKENKILNDVPNLLKKYFNKTQFKELSYQEAIKFVEHLPEFAQEIHDDKVLEDSING